MDRMIFEVYAKIVDANGSYNTLSGYPKVFDSRNYDNDINKAFRRAQGEFYETFGAMCKRDDRKLQTVILMRADGTIDDVKSIGTLHEPDPEPEETQE